MPSSGLRPSSASERSNSGGCQRGSRVQANVVRCGLLEGASLEDVRAILGPADAAYVQEGERYRDYNVGSDRGSVFRIDPEYFSIKFSANGEYRASCSTKAELGRTNQSTLTRVGAFRTEAHKSTQRWIEGESIGLETHSLGPLIR